MPQVSYHIYSVCLYLSECGVWGEKGVWGCQKWKSHENLIFILDTASTLSLSCQLTVLSLRILTLLCEWHHGADVQSDITEGIKDGHPINDTHKRGVNIMLVKDLKYVIS